MNGGRATWRRFVSPGNVRWNRVASAFLPTLFASMTINYLLLVASKPWLVGLDGRIYYRATAAWLTGGNPWLAASDGYAFAAPPPTLLFMLPTVALPEPVAAALSIAVAGLAAVFAVRTLKLASYWLLFPPLVEGVIVGNPNLAVLALLLLGSRAAGVAAAVAKIYAVIPLLIQGKESALVGSAALLLLTLPVLPWWTFVQNASQIGGTLSAQAAGGTGFSAASVPMLVAPVGVALLALGRKRSAWLAVPALWPATQAHYEVLALPAMHPILASLAVIREPWSFSAGVILYAAWVVVRPQLPLRVQLWRMDRSADVASAGDPLDQGVAT